MQVNSGLFAWEQLSTQIHCCLLSPGSHWWLQVAIQGLIVMTKTPTAIEIAKLLGSSCDGSDDNHADRISNALKLILHALMLLS